MKLSKKKEKNFWIIRKCRYVKENPTTNLLKWIYTHEKKETQEKHTSINKIS